MEKFENRIDELLRGDRRTQAWLAEQIGKGTGMVNRYCRNLVQPTLETAHKIALTLNVTVTDLIKEEEKAD